MGEEVEISKSNLWPDATLSSIFLSQIEELAEIRNPAEDNLDELSKYLLSDIKPVYVFLPWRNQVLEMIPEHEFFEIKTNRNQLLITSKEQKALYALKVSIAGMSVGSSILYGLVGAGIAKSFVISDFDSYSTSNLNRVQATVIDVGKNKAVVARRRALEMNPFVNITVMTEPITVDNMNVFFGHDTSDIIFEEIDDFKMKIAIREAAKELKKPFVMLTNLADSVQIDVERHDRGDFKIFNGYVSDQVISSIKEKPKISTDDMKLLSVSLVDSSLLPESAFESLRQIGTKLVGRPQLYSTVALDSGIAPYLVRCICLENSIQSGRYVLSLNDVKGSQKA